MKHYCVIGFPVRHSLSPRLHNRAFRLLKIPAKYEAAEVKPRDLRSFMKKFRQNFDGANVTIPHKETIIPFLDKLSPEARRIGAVNIIVNKNGKLIGYNTDVFGALSALRDVKLRSKITVVLGAGGAARAIVHGLKKSGAKVAILNRTEKKAEKLAEEFKCEFGHPEDFSAMECDVLINATSVGMWKEKNKRAKFGGIEDSPLPDLHKILKTKSLKPVVMDIIYRPKLTRFLKDAKKAGCKIIPGEKMFFLQAAKSFELWTGKKFPAKVLSGQKCYSAAARNTLKAKKITS